MHISNWSEPGEVGGGLAYWSTKYRCVRKKQKTMRIGVQCTLSSCTGTILGQEYMYVILLENSVRFITSLKRCDNVCVGGWEA